MEDPEADGGPQAVSIYPIALGAYRDQTNTAFDADAEAADIMAVLAPLLGETVVPWVVSPGARHSGEVKARLSGLAKDADQPTALVWVGHGTSNTQNASLIVPGVVSSQDDEELLPADLGAKLTKQAARRRNLDPRPWTLVVVEACGAGRFVELVSAHLLTQGRIRGVGLIGFGDPEGRGHTATAAAVLGAVVDSFDPNDTVIRLSDLLAEVEERLGDDRGLVSSSHLRGCVIERPQLVFSAPLDVYAQLRSALAELPPDEQAHFARKGMGSDFGELSWSFVGRARERARVVSHLAHERGLLAVTGTAGSGKSAVLGNVLLRVRSELRRVLVEAGFLDEDPPSPEESELQVDAWQHLSGLTSREVVDALTAASGCAADRNLTEPEAVAALLAAQQNRDAPMRVVADALDESRDPEAIADVLRQLARAGACVAVGTRPSLRDSADHPAPDARELLDHLGVKDHEAQWVRRDPEALRVYLEQELARQHTALAPDRQRRIIDAICSPDAIQPDSSTAGTRGFLYARLLLNELATRTELDDPSLDELLSGDHRTIFAAAMRRLTDEHPNAAHLLEALAFAQGNGFPRVGSVWATIAGSLCGQKPSAADIDAALELGAPYIAIGAEHGQAVYRLAHRTFQEHFQETCTAESTFRVAESLIDLTRQTAADPNPYLVAYLAGHVGEAGGPGWELLAKNESLLDIIDPTAVAREVMRTAFGHIAMPPQLSGVLSNVDTLSDCLPNDRQGVRQLSTAWFTSSAPGEGTPGTWSLHSVTRPRRSPHLTLMGHTDWVRAVTSFTTQEGRVLLATASHDKTVRIWDPTTSRQIGEPLTGHTEEVSAVTSFTTRRGQILLATGSADKTVRIWDPTTSRQIGEPLTGHTEEVSAVTSFTTRRGQILLATGSADKTVRIWDPITGRQARRPMRGHTGQVSAVTSFTTRQGKVRLATTSADATVRIWDPATGNQIGEPLTGHTGQVSAVTSFTTPQGQVRLATVGLDQMLRVWDPAIGRQVRPPMTGHTGGIWAVTSFTARQGRVQLVTASHDTSARIWDPTIDDPGGPVLGHTGRVSAVTSFVNRRGQVHLVTASHDTTIRIWDPTTGARLRRPLASHRWISGAVSFTTREGQVLLATAGHDKTVRIWDPTTGDQVGDPLTGHTLGVSAVASLTTEPGWTLLATASYDRTIRLWDPATGGQIGEPLTGHIGAVRSITSFTNEAGQVLLATASHDKTARIWNPTTGSQVIAALTGHTDHVNAVRSFATGDGQVLLATSSNDKTIRIWDPTTGNQIGDPLTSHADSVREVTSFTSKGQVLLASAGDDKTVCIWDPTCSRPLHTLHLHAQITALTALPDGSLVVGLADGWARLRLPD